jgi:hypothetical protein
LSIIFLMGAEVNYFAAKQKKWPEWTVLPGQILWKQFLFVIILWP